jgi:coenzyme F420 hydrogenase subunit beta
MKLNNIDDIVDLDLCVGCGLCQAIAGEDRIKMHLNQDGFLRPQVVGDYAEFWGEIKQACPGIVVRHEGHLEHRPWDRLWGPVLDIKAGYATDETVRWCGSSGGGISGLLCYLLEQGHVDYVLHVGASSANPLQNQVYLSQNREDVIRCAGSRYAPAAPLINVKNLLEQNDVRIAFVGKPCDVAALRAFLQLYPNLAPKVVCMIAFLCAGTPSTQATEEMVRAMGANPAKVVDLRYRGHGWPGQARAMTDDGIAHAMSYHESWGKILGRQLQFRCKICADGMGELADVVCGDAWYIEKGSPKFEEKEGRSLIIGRTHLGVSVVEGAVEKGYLVVEDFSLQDIEIIQPYQAMRRRLVASRLLAMMISGVFYPQYRGFHLIQNAFRISLKDNWLSFKGMLRRLRSKPYYKDRPVFRWFATIAARSSRSNES